MTLTTTAWPVRRYLRLGRHRDAEPGVQGPAHLPDSCCGLIMPRSTGVRCRAYFLDIACDSVLTQIEPAAYCDIPA
jgi:hypothetical protein